MKMKLVFAIISIALIMPALPQVRTLKPTLLTLAKPKIHVTGHAQYYGNAKYISAYITLKIKGRPLSNVKVWINNSLMMNHGDGNYGGSIPSTYRIRLGNELVFTAEFPKTLYRTGSPPPFTGKIELGSYKISNIINWVWPKPGETLPMGRFLTYLFEWDFTGTPARTEFFIKDKSTNKKIYTKILSAEQQSVMAGLFKPGKEYVMGMWAVRPIDNFKLSKYCARGSKIDWYFSSTMIFNTVKSFTPLIRK
ncbi:MAG: hypothetical protein KAS21_01255 [Candidatus Aminicenantes bacterium]|nr:hypothetical protein [Candidatus Aminicenantes bacterium]